MLTEYWTREGRGKISLSCCSWSIDVFNDRYNTRYYCLCGWSCNKIFRESNRRWYCESQEDFQIPSRDIESWVKYQVNLVKALEAYSDADHAGDLASRRSTTLSISRRCYFLVQSKTSICFDFNHRGWNCSFKWSSQRISVAKEALCRVDSDWQTKAFFVDNEAAIS